jgi:hypothetical protein
VAIFTICSRGDTDKGSPPDYEVLNIYDARHQADTQHNHTQYGDTTAPLNDITNVKHMSNDVVVIVVRCVHVVVFLLSPSSSLIVIVGRRRWSPSSCVSLVVDAARDQGVTVTFGRLDLSPTGIESAKFDI